MKKERKLIRQLWKHKRCPALKLARCRRQENQSLAQKYFIGQYVISILPTGTLEIVHEMLMCPVNWQDSKHRCLHDAGLILGSVADAAQNYTRIGQPLGIALNAVWVHPPGREAIVWCKCVHASSERWKMNQRSFVALSAEALTPETRTDVGATVEALS